MVETARQQTSPGGPSTPTTDRDAELRGNAPSSTEFDKAVSTTQPSTAPSFAEHTIRSGENLTSIAKKYRSFTAADTDAVLAEILEANPSIESADRIRAGQIIRIPLAPRSTEHLEPEPTPDLTRPQYTVKGKDTLSGIAQSQLGSVKWVKLIVALNPALQTNPDDIRPGQQLTLPRLDELTPGQAEGRIAQVKARTVEPLESAQSYSEALTLLNRLEGGVNSDPNDRANQNGKVTNRGITQGTYDAWRKTKGEEERSVLNMTDSERSSILRERYWNPSQAAYLPEPLATVHFVTAVSMDPHNANRMLQRALGRPETGNLTDEDIMAARNADPRQLTTAYLDKCERRYHWIADTFPNQKRFEAGWVNRVEALRTFAS